MDFFRALQAKALLAVLKPDHEAWLRHVYRWYSRTFSTPLHEVEDLALQNVLLAYYEEAFENMEDVQRQEFLDLITETEEERKKRAAKQEKAEADDDDFYAQLNAEVAKGMKPGAKPASPAKPAPKPKREPLIVSTTPPRPLTPKLEAPAPLPEMPDDLPEINMDFGDGNLLDGLLDKDPLAPPPRKKP